MDKPKEIKNEKEPLLLLEGELLLGQANEIPKSEVKVQILDITHIDSESILFAETVKLLKKKKRRPRIPYKIYGPEPEPSRRYIVVSTISVENANGEKSTLYRTTRSIPLFMGGYPEVLAVPLTRIN